MASLIGRSPNNSFKELLTMGGANGLTTDLKPVTDGKGATAPLSLSVSGVGIMGSIWPTQTPSIGKVLSMGADNQLEWITPTSTGGGDSTFDETAFWMSAQ